MELVRLLGALISLGGSDLHLQAGAPPMVRIGGDLKALDVPPLQDSEIREIMRQISPGDAQIRLEKDRSADFAFEMVGASRFRINAFYERQHLALAFRRIPLTIPAFADLHLPPVIEEIAMSPRGLVLVTGTTGSGKSTTLAAMIDYVNTKRHDRIITIEDPIEFQHTNKKSLVAQRELGQDTPSFNDSLRVALRQDPDLILVGELRDAVTMRTALQAADTGHIVYSTMHTTNASQTVQRMIALFPPDERDLLKMQLAANLEAVISQRLAKTRNGKDRLPVVEVMRSSPVVRKIIAEQDTSLLPQAIANGDGGMQLFDQHLTKLHKSEAISGTEALRLATNPEALAMMMRGLSTKDLQTSMVR
ncbi:MAG: PilT/PilU family type 4a pilus ATPase [Planctomycetes bacterium]|nr:PilT/PilU family type 4a pilus ATPase [Planctomycetota bacterium]